jgi:vacuolar-type H+-ATPase subunit H
MQDFLSPELRELKARLESVEHQVEELKSSVNEQFRDLRGSVQEQFHQAEHRAEKRHEDTMFVLRQGLEVRGLAERLAAVEEKLRDVRH